MEGYAVRSTGWTTGLVACQCCLDMGAESTVCCAWEARWGI